MMGRWILSLVQKELQAKCAVADGGSMVALVKCGVVYMDSCAGAD